MKMKLIENYCTELKSKTYKLGEFGYYGDFVAISNEILSLSDDKKTAERAKSELACNFRQTAFQKDAIDPLKRGNGMFNGRTYGNGRFVLIDEGFFSVWRMIKMKLGIV